MQVPPTLEPGTVVADKYRVDRLLGTGGFGEVYRAIELSLDRPVALKVLPANQGSETLRTRFKREAKLMAKLSSPNTVRLFESGEWGDRLYLALELVDGRDLAAILEAEGPFDGPRIVSVLRQALRSLAEAHGAGVLHRDIKLQNLMMYRSADQTDLIKLLDFGIGRLFVDDEAEERPTEEIPTLGSTLGRPLTSEGEMIGTPRYMSPEQARGRAVGPTSDLYSLGIVALELATGRPWLTGNSPLEIALHHVQPEPNRMPAGIELDRDLIAIIERLAEKRPEARYRDAGEALEDLDRWERREALQVVSTLDSSAEFALKPTDLTGNTTARGIPTWMTAVPTRTGKFRYEFEMRNFDEQRLAVELYDTEPMLLRITTVPAQRGMLLLLMPIVATSVFVSGAYALGAVAIGAAAFLLLSRTAKYRIVELTVEGDTFQLDIQDDTPVASSGSLDALRRVEIRDERELWLAAADPERDALLATISDTARNRARWVEGKLNQRLARAPRPDADMSTPVTVPNVTQ